MFRQLCNELCIRLGQMVRARLKPLAIWLAGWVGLVILPPGYAMFSNELAKQVGVERATMHQKLKSWQAYNQRQGKRSHFRKARWWTYGSVAYWFENEFSWSSESTVRRAFDDLEKAGLLLIDRMNGKLWLSAVTGEAVNLTPAPVNVQMDLFTLESGLSNCNPSIVNPTTSTSSKRKRQPAGARGGIRRDAVADFVIPEHREQIAEKRDPRESDEDGRDNLHELPGELVTQWADSHLPLEDFVAAHGVEQVKSIWAQTTTYQNRVAGLRSRLAISPSPRSAPPPSNETTEQDWTEQEITANETPAVDVDDPQARQWAAALSQLEAQLDGLTFAAWIKGVTVARTEGAVWVLNASSERARAMLQDRLYREIRRVLRDVVGQPVELRFEVTGVVQHG